MTVRMVSAELRLPASTIRCMSADYIPVRMHGSLSPNLRKNDLETCKIRKTYRWFVLLSHNTLTAEFICNIIKIEQLNLDVPLKKEEGVLGKTPVKDNEIRLDESSNRICYMKGEFI